MAAEQPATTSATAVPATPETEPVAAENPAAVADPVRSEFRLTADRRRILVPLNRAATPQSA